jgi:hypothetical protein
MARITMVLALAMCAIASIAVGFWFGFREGWNIGAMAMMAPRGALSSSLLQALAEGKPEKVTVFLESDIDNALLWSHSLEQSPLSRLLRPIWGLDAFPRDVQYVVRTANYRMAHPSPWDSRALDHSSHEMMETIHEMTEKYATER